MDINASIVDQQLTGILSNHPEWFPMPADEHKRATAFVLLCIAAYLDISLDEAQEVLTDGGNDAGVDGLYVGEVEDGEFPVIVFQAKYKVKNLDGSSNFPEGGIEKAINTLRVLFDPSRKVSLNKKLEPKIEEIRSLIRDAYIPKVRFVLCNNGTKWTDSADDRVRETEREFSDKVEFIHFNHNSIVKIRQRVKSVDATLPLSGKMIVEDMNYMRVLVGRISVRHIANLFEEHGDRLLQRNIRRYLGIHENRVNTAIHETLRSDKADKFYFYNNVITVVCDKFDYNAFQQDDHHVQLKNMQIINGGQTCKTIHQTLSSDTSNAAGHLAYVMIRIYQMAEENKDLVQDITYATNSQNPVDLRDLRSNDPIQKSLETGIHDLGYLYKRQRDEANNTATGANTLSGATVAESILAIWRKKPHQAKFRRTEHFGKLYRDIFTGINAAQAVLAVLIFRDVENKRKRPVSDNPPPFLPYASHYLAMLVGLDLLKKHKYTLDQVSHRSFRALHDDFEKNKTEYYSTAIEQIEAALKNLYGRSDVSLQQLSATFRRGDLLERLGL